MSKAARDRSFDVIVVGAGPAGCAAAAAVLQADPGLRLLLLDRADFPRDKACGDGIAFEVTETLDELGFDTDAIFRGTQAISELALRSPSGVAVRRTMRRDVHVIPREIFDFRLVQDLQLRGVELGRHSVKSIEQTANGVLLDGMLHTKILIGADGANSIVRRSVQVPPAKPGRVALAIRGYAPVSPDLASTQFITMTDRHWPAYAWSFPIGGGLANVGYGEVMTNAPMNRTDMLTMMHQLLPGLPDHVDRLRAHRLPLSSGRPPITAGPILLVGDAQSMINPFTGEGIYYAVVSGMLAGQAAANACRAAGTDTDADARAAADAGSEYRSTMRRRLGWHLRHTTALARAGGWPSLIDAGMRAARNDQRCFDDLVNFGLGEGLLTPRLISRLRFRGN